MSLIQTVSMSEGLLSSLENIISNLTKLKEQMFDELCIPVTAFDPMEEAISRLHKQIEESAKEGGNKLNLKHFNRCIEAEHQLAFRQYKEWILSGKASRKSFRRNIFFLPPSYYYSFFDK